MAASISRTVFRTSVHPLLRSPSFSLSTSLNNSAHTTTLKPSTKHEDSGHANVYDEHHSEHYLQDVHPPKFSVPLHPWRSSFCALTLNYNTTRLYPSRSVYHSIQRRYSTSPPQAVATPSPEGAAAAAAEKKKVAVVLSGCGVYDGSEVHEAVSVLVHLSRAGIDARCFAPDIEQSDVVNHLKGSPSAEGSRNVLVESARIARGKIKPLSSLKADSYSAVIFPGGYGAAKNLCTFASQAEHHVVLSDVQRVIKEFHGAKKPIGMLCVSPVIVAKLIPGVTVTLGNEDKDIEKAIASMGAISRPLGVLEVAIDETNNVITSPAYMTNSPIHSVFDGIGRFVEALLERTAAQPTCAAPTSTEPASAVLPSPSSSSSPLPSPPSSTSLPKTNEKI